MVREEKFTVEIQKYAIVGGRVVLFDVELSHSGMFDEDEVITSAGLVCIWKKGSVQQIICCDEGVCFSVLSKPEIDQQLIAKHMGILLCN